MSGAKGMHSVEAAVQQQHGGEGGEEGQSVGGKCQKCGCLRREERNMNNKRGCLYVCY